MLYLHCGWPKTGTSTLQRALVENRARLAAVGSTYPVAWTRENDDSHRLFGGDPDSAIGRAQAFLEAHADEDVLISSEVLSLRLFRGEYHDVLVDLIAAARRAMPVRCIWTLRRFDDVVHSVCLHRARFGIEVPGADCLARLDPTPLFAGMRAMGDAADEVVQVRYDPQGGHQLELLGALGIPSVEAEAVWRDLRTAPRANVGSSHKEVAVLLNLEAVSARCGIPLEARRLRELFAAGRLRFEDDRRCNLFDADTRRALHETALTAARKAGGSAYGEFFGDEEIGSSVTPPSGDPDSLTDEDLRRLAAELRSASPA
jgi:hypothetical protein